MRPVPRPERSLPRRPPTRIMIIIYKLTVLSIYSMSFLSGHCARCCRSKAQTQKPQYKAKNRLMVDTDRENVSFLCELVMGRKLRSTVPGPHNVL